MDTQASINAFKNEETDTTGTSVAGSAELLSNFSGLGDKAQIRRGLGMSIAVIELNSTRGALQDVAVRKAFCQVVDPATIVSTSSRVLTGKRMHQALCFGLIGQLVMTTTSQTISRTSSLLTSARLLQRRPLRTQATSSMAINYEKDGQQVTFSYTLFGDGTTVKNRAAAIQKMCKDRWY